MRVGPSDAAGTKKICQKLRCAILIALKLGAAHAAHRRLRLPARSDSVTAISAVTKLSARTSVLNALGAEMALILEENECSHPEAAT